MNPGRTAYSISLLCLFASVSAAPTQGVDENRDVTRVIQTLIQVEQCIRADELLRGACSRIGTKLSDRNRHLCTLPPSSFQSRTASDYQSFEARHRRTIDDNRQQIVKVLSRTQNAFDNQFRAVMSGRYSMLDIESLHDEVTGRCIVIEAEWLKESGHQGR